MLLQQNKQKLHKISNYSERHPGRNLFSVFVTFCRPTRCAAFRRRPI